MSNHYLNQLYRTANGTIWKKIHVKCESECNNFHSRKINLTHWGWAIHICVSRLTTIGSDNGLSPDRCQAIIWTNAAILLIGSLGTNFSEILIEIFTFSFKKMHLKMPSEKCQPSYLGLNVLTHWGRVRHICIGKLAMIGSDNGLAPGRRQAIIWTNAGILSIGPLGTNFSEILIGIQTFSFKKMHFKMPSEKWRPSCLSLNVLKMSLKMSSAKTSAILFRFLSIKWPAAEYGLQ